MRKVLIVAASLVVVLSGIGLAPAASAATQDITFTNATTSNGLGTSSVNGVYAVGSTIYAATYGGLSISTDGGATFTNYTTDNGLGDNYLLGVYEQGGTIYAATPSGLSFSVAPPASSPIPMWQQAIGRASASAPCPDGYTGSWDTWPNSGTGGFVCNRFIPAYGN